MNFFNGQCQKGPFAQELFGVCDDQKGQVAYVDPDAANADKWIARVENAKQIPVTLTAIDKCVLQDTDAPGRGRCDAMLTTDRLLYLLELKDQRSDWRQHAYEQLESTIQFLHEAHPADIKRFTTKKAFACNRKHPAFVVLEPELKLRFSKYGFRIDTQATVVVVS